MIYSIILEPSSKEKREELLIRVKHNLLSLAEAMRLIRILA